MSGHIFYCRDGDGVDVVFDRVLIHYRHPLACAYYAAVAVAVAVPLTVLDCDYPLPEPCLEEISCWALANCSVACV